MSRVVWGLAFFIIISCSTQEGVSCESGTGYLYKDGMEFVCSFTLQKRTGQGWIDYDGGVTVLAYDAGDYFPLIQWNAKSMYKLKMNVSKKYFTEEQYAVSLWAIDKKNMARGESREFMFYKVAESADSVEYHSRIVTDTVYGKYVFFAEREMPSHDWYHVLNVGKYEGNKGFCLKGEVAK
jgi:hypothetical protein